MYTLRPNILTFTLILVLQIACLTQIGCSKSTHQSVYVGQPQVFTRERLISQRSEEINWLREQLNKTEYYNFNVQGTINERLFKLVELKLKAEINPAGLGGGGAGTGTGDTTTNGADPVAPAAPNANGTTNAAPPETTQNNPPQVEEPDPNVDKFVDAIVAKMKELDLISASSDKPQIHPTELLKDRRAFRNAVRQAIQEEMLDDVHDLHGNLLYDLKFDLTLIPEADDNDPRAIVLQIAPLEMCCVSESQLAEMRTAWQEALSQEISDETVALYNRLSANIDRSTARNARHDARMAKVLRGLKQIDIDKILESFVSEQLTREEREKFAPSFKSSFELFDSVGGKTNYVSLQRILEDPKYLNQVVATAPKGKVLWLIARVFSQYYEDRLDGRVKKLLGRSEENGGFVHITVKPAALFGFSIKPILTDEKYSDITSQTTIHPNDDGNNTFRSILIALDKTQYPRAQVFAVKPQELAQNIADTATMRDLSSLLLVGGGPIIPELNLNASLQRLPDHQIALESIQRQPLLLGFNQGERRFGWVLGPKFEINRTDSVLGATTEKLIGLRLDNRRSIDFAFYQAPTRYSVGATIVAPAWHRRLAITVHTYRIDADSGKWTLEDTYQPGYEIPRYGFGTEAKNKIGPAGEEITLSPGAKNCKIDQNEGAAPDLVVTLPGDLEALTTALLAHENPLSLQPAIGASGVGSAREELEWTLRADQKQTLLILGRNLWRSPEVYVGDVKADGVTVTSDLKGLYATFDRFPVSAGDGVQKMALTVVTSQGHDVLDEAVTVLPPRSSNVPSAFFSIDAKQHTYADDKSPPTRSIALTIDKAKLPKGWADITIKARQAGKNTDSFKTVPGTLMLASDFKSARFTPAAKAGLKGNTLYDLAVELTPTANAKPVSVLKPGNKTIAVFKDKEGHKLNITDPAAGAAVPIATLSTPAGQEIKLNLADKARRIALVHVYPDLAPLLAGKVGQEAKATLGFTNTADSKKQAEIACTAKLVGDELVLTIKNAPNPTGLVAGTYGVRVKPESKEAWIPLEGTVKFQ